MRSLTRERTGELLRKMPSQQIAVIGDVMLDQYFFGSMETSPEPPFVKFRVEREEYRLGGAGNVARNLAVMGAHVVLVGVVGLNQRAEVTRLLHESSIYSALVFDDERPTTIKKRYLTSGIVEFRADTESKKDVSTSVENALCQRIEKYSSTAHAIIISDYQKGVITEQSLKKATETAKAAQIPTFADPKFRKASFYRGIDVLKLNEKETSALLQRTIVSEDDALRAGEDLLQETGATIVVLTRGQAGLILFERSKMPIRLQSDKKEVFDVVGAGDTVISAFALAYTCGALPEEAAILANKAAGIVVTKVGTAAPTALELLQNCEP